MSKISVIIKDPGIAPRRVYISNTLENLQRTVGGYIETVTPMPGLVIICDEEGRLKNKGYCCTLCGVDFVGTVILAGVKDDEFADVPMSFAQAKKLFPQLWERGIGSRSAKKVSIWQIDRNVAAEKMFREYDFVRDYMGGVDLHQYRKVYEGTVEVCDRELTLEDIFEIFNSEPPKGYRGHSLSVGDIIVIMKPHPYRFFYVDKAGFRELTWADRALPPTMKMKEIERAKVAGSEPPVAGSCEDDREGRIAATAAGGLAMTDGEAAK